MTDELVQFSEIVSADRQNIDMQSLVIQYDDPSDLSYIQNYIRSKRNKNSTSFINNWVTIDAFINLGFTMEDLPQNRWVRIIYECLQDNPTPSTFNDRFSNCYILHVDVKKMKGVNKWNIISLPQSISKN